MRCGSISFQTPLVPASYWKYGMCARRIATSSDTGYVHFQIDVLRLVEIRSETIIDCTYRRCLML